MALAIDHRNKPASCNKSTKTHIKQRPSFTTYSAGQARIASLTRHIGENYIYSRSKYKL